MIWPLAKTPAAAESPLSVAAGEAPGTVTPGEGRPAPGLQGRGWEVAALLYEQLRKHGIPCGIHKPSAPEDNCPHCGDEAALRVYRATCGMAEPEPGPEPEEAA